MRLFANHDEPENCGNEMKFESRNFVNLHRDEASHSIHCSEPVHVLVACCCGWRRVASRTAAPTMASTNTPMTTYGSVTNFTANMASRENAPAPVSASANAAAA